jgi:tryptophan-rich sensory protein
MNIPSLFALCGFVGVCFLAALSGAFFRPGVWYDNLAKPWWRPPKFLFPPAWTILYITMAISGWLVWKTVGFAAPLAVYFVSLIFNAAWSAFFFGLRRPDLAFLDVVFLWLSIAATIAVFYPVEKPAAYLLLPYLGWVTFAGGLNFTIWQMNRKRMPA